MKQFIALLIALCLVPVAFAQTLAERGTPLDHLAGRWIMTGTIAGQEIVHDLTSDWVLAGHYLRFHEIARERDENGDPAYEAMVYFGWDEPNERLVCLWLDITGGGGLVPDGFGYGRPEGDRIPFVWGAGTDSQIHNTFTYQNAQDTWTWRIDNVREGKAKNFAQVVLKRQIPEENLLFDWLEQRGHPFAASGQLENIQDTLTVLQKMQNGSGVFTLTPFHSSKTGSLDFAAPEIYGNEFIIGSLAGQLFRLDMVCGEGEQIKTLTNKPG